jgi:hypothetical protein
LGVPPDPDFDIVLPPGWSRRGVDDDTFNMMIAGLRRRTMEAHKPEIYAEARRLLKKSFDDMRQAGAFAFFSATEQDDSTLWIPASIIASIRRPEPGHSLDDFARDLIRNHGAAPLMGDMKTLRFEKESIVSMGAESVVSHSVTYLIPMPGTKRRRALQLVGGFSVALGTSSVDDRVAATKFLFDSCVSSLRWTSAPATA